MGNTGHSAKGQHVLRARRLKAESFPPGALSASIANESDAMFLEVLDISSFGAQLSIAKEGNSVLELRLSDRLERLCLRYADVCLYQGAAVVRYVNEDTDDGPRILVGLEMLDGPVDLAALQRCTIGQGFDVRWAKVEKRFTRQELPQRFVYELHEAARYLKACAEFLDGEERAIAAHDKLTREKELAAYLDAALPSFLAHMNRFGSLLCEAYSEIDPSLHSQFRSLCQSLLLPLWLRAPVIRRSYEKPLGYAGDYEVMNHFYRDHREGESMFARMMNVFFIQCEAARANINRLELLGGKIRDVIGRQPAGRKARIVSVGSGPAMEVHRLISADPALGARLDLTLIDQDDRAMNFCETNGLPEMIQTQGGTVRLVCENIARIIARGSLGATLNRQDLIYSAGLFDYLSDRVFRRLAQVLYDGVAEGNELLVGNVNVENPSRGIMEFVVDWFLHHRSASELQEIGASLSPTATKVEVIAEPLGVNLFLRVQK